MIIWLSGPYGVGKSTLAKAMSAKMKSALIFDAEEVGNAVRDNYPDCPYGYIFEDCWCMENIELAREGCAALPGIHIQTDGRTVEELCDEVLNIIRKT